MWLAASGPIYNYQGVFSNYRLILLYLPARGRFCEVDKLLLRSLLQWTIC